MLHQLVLRQISENSEIGGGDVPTSSKQGTGDLYLPQIYEFLLSSNVLNAHSLSPI